MCGIAGYAGWKSAPCGEDVLRAMGAALRHRGPDASGAWRSPDGAVGLAHARLAIIDLSPRGAQPMRSGDGRFVISFNGELYNFKELKKELSPYPFKSDSDTEVLLAAYERWGVGAFARLRGMFALALWDTREREILLARDPAGEKPLYWTHANGVLIFGSELKALRVHPQAPRALDMRALGHYLAREYVPTPRTIYAGVQKLLPASYLRFKDGSVHIKPYWRPREDRAIASLSETDALARFDSLLQEAVREQLVADVPLGIFLSGGIDSSTIAYYAARASSQKVKTFSIAFGETSFDESSHARLVAAHLGTDHHEATLRGRDALALVRDIPEVFDEPVADASVLPTMLLSRFAREEVTVALGGDGADELLLGYPTFRAERYAAAYRHLPAAARRAARAATDLLPASAAYMNFGFKARKFAHDFADDPLERHLSWLGSFREDALGRLLAPDAAAHARGVTRELVHQWAAECLRFAGLNALSHLYLRTYLLDQVLVKVDRASMRYALEVRAPFLSRDLMEFLLALPPELKYRRDRGKYLLRALMRGRLPDVTLDRHKKGFAAPVAQWLRGELRELATDALSPDALRRSGVFNAAEVSRLLGEHLAGGRDHAKQLWTLLVFQLWWERWMR